MKEIKGSPGSHSSPASWRNGTPDGRGHARPHNAALEHFAIIGYLMGPLMETATITGELLGTPNDQIRNNLTGTNRSCSNRGWHCRTRRRRRGAAAA
jgi:hypothetical protein